VEQEIDLARKHTGLNDVTVHRVSRAGDPARALVEAAEGAVLLVLGRRGHGALVSALIGSTANYVLHHPPCPILVSPREDVQPLERVVVGLDGSAVSRTALAFAADAARRLGLPLVAVHAWTFPETPFWPLGTPRPDDERTINEIEDWLASELTALTDVPTERRVLHGTTASSLIAATKPSDLLVIGSRGQGGFAALLLGSTALQVAHHGHGPVVVVPQG
jgi:nucleotide-binding universal stress UspA family protein